MSVEIDFSRFDRPGYSQARDRLMSGAELMRLATVLYPPVPEVKLEPPWSGFGEYIHAQRVRRTQKFTQESYAAARENLNREIDKLDASTKTAISKVWESSKFDVVAGNALAAGASVAAAGAGIGALFGPLGAVIGAAGGFIIGFIVGLFPFEKQAFLDQWASIIRGLSPLERMMMIASLRGYSDQACGKLGRPVWPAWRIGDEGGILRLHTIAQGEDVLVLFCLEMLLEKDAFIASADPAIRAYALATVASFTDDNSRLDSSPLAGRLLSGSGGAWIAGLVEADRATLAKELRTRATALGYSDYGMRPMSDEISAALLEAGYGR